jgi:hypothetical protein
VGFSRIELKDSGISFLLRSYTQSSDDFSTIDIQSIPIVENACRPYHTRRTPTDADVWGSNPCNKQTQEHGEDLGFPNQPELTAVELFKASANWRFGFPSIVEGSKTAKSNSGYCTLFLLTS